MLRKACNDSSPRYAPAGQPPEEVFRLDQKITVNRFYWVAYNASLQDRQPSCSFGPKACLLKRREARSAPVLKSPDKFAGHLKP
jgi:hypothetical protein